MRSWSEERICRAVVIRDILRGQLACSPDPHGLRLRGARISGRLDLEGVATKVSLQLTDCLLEEGVQAQGASLTFLGLAGCLLEHSADPPLDADRLTCGALVMNRAQVNAHAAIGAVRLSGASIDGNLELEGARLRNDSGAAIYASGLRVGQSMLLRKGFTATSVSADATIRLIGSSVGRTLECDGAVLLNKSGPALQADAMQVGLGALFRNGFTATSSGKTPTVRLFCASIGGTLDFDGAVLRNESGPALDAEGLRVDQSVLFRKGFSAAGKGSTAGTVRLSRATIGGHLECRGANLRNDSGPALQAEGMQVSQSVFLLDKLEATGSSRGGAVRLFGAGIGGNLECDGAVLRNDSGPALDAEGLRVGQAMYLRHGFTATGAGRAGAVRLFNASVGGNLECDGAVLRNDSGPALQAEGLRVGQAMYLRHGFTAAGAGSGGAVRLIRAHVGAQLDFAEADVRDDSGPALLARGLQVELAMYLHDNFAATGGGDGVTVDLSAARVNGMLVVDLKQLVHRTDPRRRIAVDGLTYADVPRLAGAGDWLDLLRDGTPEYAAQPYQQLAAGYRTLGDDQQVRKTLMSQRDDQLARTDPRWPERLWGWVTKVTLGYGYQPWRALLFLVALVAASCVIAVSLGAHGALAQTDETATPGRACTVVQKVSVGLDLNLPVGTSAARAGCDLTKNSASVTADWLAATGWCLKLLAWVFAALFIAGFTSAVRKT